MVVLPYKLSELEPVLRKSNNQYGNIQDLINDKYVLPISRFKFPFASRFKEGYSLLRNRENGSIIDSIRLGLRLSSNTLLNPAVIAACKNLDELDIYLNYLFNNNLDNFNIFKVQYDALPAKC